MDMDTIKSMAAYNDAKAKVDEKKNGELTEELRKLLENGKVRTEELIESLNEYVKTAEALVEWAKVIEWVEKEIAWVKHAIWGCKKRLNWFTYQLAAYAH